MIDFQRQEEEKDPIDTMTDTTAKIINIIFIHNLQNALTLHYTSFSHSTYIYIYKIIKTLILNTKFDI